MISLIGVVVVRVAAGNFQERRRHPLLRVGWRNTRRTGRRGGAADRPERAIWEGVNVRQHVHTHVHSLKALILLAEVNVVNVVNLFRASPSRGCMRTCVRVPTCVGGRKRFTKFTMFTSGLIQNGFFE